MDKNTIIEKVIKLFADNNDRLNLNQISKSLRIQSDSPEYIKLKNALNELVQQNILKKYSRRKYALIDQEILAEFTGVIRQSKGVTYINVKGDGFERVFIQRKDLNTAFAGDKVKVKLNAVQKASKPKGEVIRIIRRDEHRIVGNLENDGDFWFLIPEEDKYYVDFLIHTKHLQGAMDGAKVAAKLLQWKDHHKSPQAEVIEIIGKAGDTEAEFDSIPAEFMLTSEFPDAVNQEAERVAKPVNPNLVKKRFDLRREDIITIDPVDAKDFDDALSLRILDNGNYYLGVHIADVSHYVEQDGALDEEAFKRGNSTYLVDRVIPMLPEVLSNDICSLKPNRVRCAYSVFMEFDKNINLKSYDVLETIIKSKKRFNYDEVLNIIETGKGPKKNLILKLHELAEQLKAKRYKKGGIRFDSSEVKFELDNNKNPVKANLKKTTKSTSLVEECMLAANKTVAEHVKKLSKKYKLNDTMPFLYRVHDEPDRAKLEDAFNFIRSFDRSVRIKGKSSKEIDRILEKFQGRSESTIISQILLRSMAKAEYSADNIGHYGLGFKDYSHFTSPIRRYPDLVVHRLLKIYSKGKPTPKTIRNFDNDLEYIAEHCVDRERVAVEAERASIKLAQALLAKEYVGKEFTGTVSGITNFGVFVVLDEIFAEGLIHIRDLHDDYYHLDEKNYRLKGKRKKKEFFFGKRLRIKISSVNVDKRKIDLAYVNDKVS